MRAGSVALGNKPLPSDTLHVSVAAELSPERRVL